MTATAMKHSYLFDMNRFRTNQFRFLVGDIYFSSTWSNHILGNAFLELVTGGALDDGIEVVMSPFGFRNL